MSDVATLPVRPPRHSWGDPVRFEFKTERTCTKCGITKVTRHEPGVRPWLEFFRDLERIQCELTPACSGVPA